MLSFLSCPLLCAEAKKPEDWDDEEDGDWEPPRVPNPKCKDAPGCGEWKRPEKPNPAYKGKWYPPLIDNPAYKGPWAPKKIPNPDYFEDKDPGKLNKIMGIGIELWTMQNNIMFDNIYVGHSLAGAFRLADETWVKKRAVEDVKDKEEKAKEAEEAKKAGDDADKLTGDDADKADATEKADAPLDINKIIKTTQTFIDKLTQDPVQAVKKYPAYAGGLLLLLFSPFILLSLFSGSKSNKDVEYVKKGASPKKSSPKKTDEKQKDDDDEDYAPDEDEEPAEEDGDDEAEPKPRKRKPTNKN